MKTLIVYDSRYGQTAKIAERIATTLIKNGEHKVCTKLIGEYSPNSIDGYQQVILGSPIYTSRHSKKLGKFIRKFRKSLEQAETGFFSVSASGAGNEKQCDDARRVMGQYLNECGFSPNRSTIFAGAVPYRKYNWFIRRLMKWIASRAGGDTDTSQNYEYTCWNRVDQFASLFAESSESASALHGDPDTSDSTPKSMATEL